MSKLINLSTTETITSNYVGDAANGLIGDALLSSKTIEKNLITLFPSIKLKQAIPRISTNGIVQLDSASFTPTSTVTLDERYLTPVPMKVNVELAKAALVNSWMANKMKPGAMNTSLPADAQAYVTQYFAKQTGQDIEKMIWAGKIGGGAGNALDNVDGIVTKALATGSGTINVAPTTLTAGNILAELTKVYTAIPATIFDKDDLVIFVSISAIRLYKLALAAGMGNGGSYYLGTSTPGSDDATFLNVRVIAVPGMPTNNMIASTVSNLAIGTDLVSDFNDIHILDMLEVTGDNTLRYVSRFTLDVNFAWEKQVVAYGTQL
jgi:hypothetical protein